VFEFVASLASNSRFIFEVSLLILFLPAIIGGMPWLIIPLADYRDFIGLTINILSTGFCIMYKSVVIPQLIRERFSVQTIIYSYMLSLLLLLVYSLSHAIYSTLTPSIRDDTFAYYISNAMALT